MVVYVYDKKTNKKKVSFKNVFRISSNETNFHVHTDTELITVEKEGIKLVVYGH